MKTYIAYDNKYYKIGRSLNPERRIKDLKTANPSIHLLFFGEGDKEGYLHDKYDNFKVAREWYDLSKSQVEEIKRMLAAKITRFTDLQQIIDFGKYKGLQLCELRSKSHKSYMLWYIESTENSNDFWKKLFELQLKRLETLSEKFKNR